MPSGDSAPMRLTAMGRKPTSCMNQRAKNLRVMPEASAPIKSENEMSRVTTSPTGRQPQQPAACVRVSVGPPSVTQSTCDGPVNTSVAPASTSPCAGPGWASAATSDMLQLLPLPPATGPSALAAIGGASVGRDAAGVLFPASAAAAAAPLPILPSSARLPSLASLPLRKLASSEGSAA